MDAISEVYAKLAGGGDRVNRILALTERLKQIRQAMDTIRWDDELVTGAPEALKLLGGAQDAVTAELKTV